MARIRTIKPEFFTDQDLAELPALVRLFFIGLWCQSDKAGRCKYKPRELGMRILPYDRLKAEEAIDQLIAKRFVIKYVVDGSTYLQVRTWDKHQRPHHTEQDSVLPPLDNGATTVLTPLDNGARTDGREGKGKERKGKEGSDQRRDPVKEPCFPEVLDTPQFRQVWATWVKHRSEIRAPLKPTQVAAQLETMAEWGEARSIAAINHTVLKGWRGLREPEPGQGGQPARIDSRDLTFTQDEP